MMGLGAQQAVLGMVRGETMPLLVRISFEVFATRATTERFFAICEKVDRRMTSRLVLLLSSVPMGVPRMRPAGLRQSPASVLPWCRLSCRRHGRVARPRFGEQFQSDRGIAHDGLQPRRSGPAADLSSPPCEPGDPGLWFGGVGSQEDAASLFSLGADMVAMNQPPTDARHP